ncbi:MAG: hypothetical protein V3R68_07510 [Gammaproteobacteria bacterium]
MKPHIIIWILLVLSPSVAMAEWQIITHTDIDTNIETNVAYTENESGYSLEIYRDAVGAVRSRFTLKTGLSRLAVRNCPTYQIDKRQPLNRSINDAPCIPERNWSEFILGYIENNEIVSPHLNYLMNGKKITYRFILENGGYGETFFSLAGSKYAITATMGRNTRIVQPSNTN